jgi:hypothetical protein
VHDIGGRPTVGRADDPVVGRNYYRVAVSGLMILLNPAALLVAATQPADPSDVTAPFAEVPGPEAFARRGFRVATAAEMEQPLLPAHLRFLTGEVRRDVAYHRPDRLGHLLFNWFD